jgi:group II intron reverse transcriptase/maturase
MPITGRRGTGYQFDNIVRVCEMQNAETILSILNEKSKQNKEFVFQRIYRLLFNADLYLAAYKKIYAKEGNMTPGVDKETIDGFKWETIEKLIEDIKFERYHPKPVRRVYIPKKNGSQRPLGVPSFQDKLVQEVIRSILEAIYEPIFLDYSHGFRPNRSCQTVLFDIKKNCLGTVWIIEGDIRDFFGSVNHKLLLELIESKIQDLRFIGLIERFLKAGYMEEGTRYNTYSGTPQGSIVSPILSNIYLHEFDKYMDLIVKQESKGERRRPNLEYDDLRKTRFYANKTGDYAKAKECLKQMYKLRSGDPFDEKYRRVKYFRYADDWIVTIIGDKYLAEEIRNEIKFFLKTELKLKLNEEKTLITNLSDRNVKFLGYEISKTREDTKLTKNSLGRKARSTNETIQLLVPSEVIEEKLKPFRKNGKAIHYSARMREPLLNIISRYNAEIRGLYYYYSLATDVSRKIGKFRYYHYVSMVKTIARKLQLSTSQVIDKYGIAVPLKQKTGTRKIVGVRYTLKTGEEKTLIYFNESLTKLDEPRGAEADAIKELHGINCQLIDRFNANECELCGKQGDKHEFEVHHVRKLKDLKDKYKKRGKQAPNWVLKMARMNRKTLIVCKECHDSIHSRRSGK